MDKRLDIYKCQLTNQVYNPYTFLAINKWREGAFEAESKINVCVKEEPNLEVNEKKIKIMFHFDDLYNYQKWSKKYIVIILNHSTVVSYAN